LVQIELQKPSPEEGGLEGNSWQRIAEQNGRPSSQLFDRFSKMDASEKDKVIYPEM
jgi:hypothetical protein